MLILCPFRGSAMAYVDMIRSVLGGNTTLSNLEKFVGEYGLPVDEDERRSNLKKPDDWRLLFDGQNVDDDFKMGIQVNPGHGKGAGADKGVYLRLYSDFYHSDIVLASPLGIRLLIENKGKAERDFLSSVEVVVLHMADVLYFQNWDHVDFVLRNLNMMLTQDRGTDFSRVRPYFLEGKALHYRQLLINTSFNDPCIQASFREFGRSLSNTIRIRRDPGEGSIVHVLSNVKQVFQLVPVSSLATEDDERFVYFVENILQPLLRMKQKRTLIVTPSYIHFIRIRNFLIDHEANAAYINEYSRDSEISRGRSRFFHAQNDILLYSGRAHFFMRYLIRGAMHIVFFSPTERPDFYSEIVNFLTEASNAGLEAEMSCVTLFTRFDQMALERIVGRKRTNYMLHSGKTTYVFK